MMEVFPVRRALFSTSLRWMAGIATSDKYFEVGKGQEDRKQIKHEKFL
jgi:hypothetical protein